MVSQYLGGFVGTEKAHDWWLEEKVAGWQDSVATLDEMECWHPQTAYESLQKYLQQEWAFMQRVTLGIGMAFQPVEENLQDTFIPALFQRVTSQIPGRAITGLQVKHYGISLPNLNHTASDNCMVSCVITGHLVSALHGTADFGPGDHALFVGEGGEEIL